jgi:hypothetical protein
MQSRLVAALLLVCLCGPAVAGDDVTALLKEIRSVGKQGQGSPAARAAWLKLVDRGPAVLPHILEAMDTPDTVAANWLRTAFDQIVETEQKAGGKRIDLDALLAFVKDARHQGRARRLGLEVVEELRPGTQAALVAGWLEDPEFRYEAVAAVLKEGAALGKGGKKEQAVAVYRKGFAAVRDVGQSKQLAARLKELGVSVSVADHLGFFRDWYVIGPFDANNMQGFKTVYPPEEKVDLAAEPDGKAGKVRWKRFQVPEPGLAADEIRYCLVNLREPLGTHHDVVAYAYTEFRLPAAVEAELRGAADDNFTIWVNGKRAFGFEEYRNGVRVDRHRFRVKLVGGVNTLLVKICQAPLDPTNPEPNWEFLLRLVDDTGKGIERQTALPEEKKE